MRTPGLHASDLYGAYYRATDPKRYDKKDAQGNPLPFDLLKLEFGLSFEQQLEDDLERLLEATRQRMAGRLFGERPGEFTAGHDDGCPYRQEPVIDGVPCPHCAAGTLYSPDYLFTEGSDLILGEFKLTWYSSREAPTAGSQFQKYWTQQMLYCHWLGIRKSRLYVFFVNGDYKPPSPSLRVWEATFTQQELQDEYNVIVRFARKKGLLKVG